MPLLSKPSSTAPSSPGCGCLFVYTLVMSGSPPAFTNYLIPKWMQTGEAIKGFWMRAVAVPEAPAKPLITFEWYRSFLQGLIDSNAQVWFGKLIAVGELLVGIALIAGIFVGIAAFFSFLMNFNFLLAGSNSTGPLLVVLAMLLMIAWKMLDTTVSIVSGSSMLELSGSLGCGSRRKSLLPNFPPPLLVVRTRLSLRRVLR